VRPVVVMVVASLLLAACSSGGGAMTPTPAWTSTPFASVTPLTTVPAGSTPDSSPAVKQALTAVMTDFYIALSSGRIDDAYNFYSACMRKSVTKESVQFGAVSTGELTLLDLTVTQSSPTAATAIVMTRSHFAIGRQDTFTVQTRFIFENGNWRINSGGAPGC
jgi:hypothetical protein